MAPICESGGGATHTKVERKRSNIKGVEMVVGTQVTLLDEIGDEVAGYVVAIDGDDLTVEVVWEGSEGQTLFAEEFVVSADKVEVVI